MALKVTLIIRPPAIGIRRFPKLAFGKGDRQPCRLALRFDDQSINVCYPIVRRGRQFNNHLDFHVNVQLGALASDIEEIEGKGVQVHAGGEV